jgi:hypothetical protein
MLLAATGLLLTACGPHPDTQIGMRATALSLQFARPDLAKPIPPNVILQILPGPLSELSPTVLAPPSLDVPTPPAPSECPPKTPAKPLKESTQDTPAAGNYAYSTKGRGTVADGTKTTTSPIPEDTQVAISEPVKVTPGTTAPVEGGAPSSGSELLYTVVTQLSGTVKQVDRLVVSATSINLAERTLVDGRRSLTFTPSPQVQLVVFGPVGSTWRSYGADSGSSANLNYQGRISAVTSVNVCGQPVNAYVVTYSETLTSPLDRELIRTVDGAANTLTIAPQLGGLVVERQVSTDDLRYDSNLGGYIEVWMEYSSALRQLQPSSASGGA